MEGAPLKAWVKMMLKGRSSPLSKAVCGVYSTKKCALAVRLAQPRASPHTRPVNFNFIYCSLCHIQINGWLSSLAEIGLYRKEICSRVQRPVAQLFTKLVN